MKEAEKQTQLPEEKLEEVTGGLEKLPVQPRPRPVQPRPMPVQPRPMPVPSTPEPFTCIKCKETLYALDSQKAQALHDEKFPGCTGFVQPGLGQTL